MEILETGGQVILGHFYETCRKPLLTFKVRFTEKTIGLNENKSGETDWAKKVTKLYLVKIYFD
ncbi:hypothetical protein [Rufibacter aurantiacus]|uniref:hypothetical protein n=1 Tax=Rufibacter aurantiacus TaxID=2817374 RepID=UPI001B303AFE|nr:hypothetical protein [Rufibacter aurantiacus]